MSQRILNITGGVAVMAAVVAAAIALSGGKDSTTATATPAAAAAGAPQQSGTASGAQNPQGAPPAMGAAVTDKAAAKVKAAALAKYPGTVEQIMQLPDGSYVAHVIKSDNTEVHVAVSKDYKVTGVAQGPGGGRPGGAPGMGTPVTGDAAAKVKAAALARYPGTVEQILKQPDGSYVAHVLASGGEVHVLVSKDYKVTGVQQGGPGAGGPPAGAPGAPGTTGTQS